MCWAHGSGHKRPLISCHFDFGKSGHDWVGFKQNSTLISSVPSSIHADEYWCVMTDKKEDAYAIEMGYISAIDFWTNFNYEQFPGQE